MSNPGKTPDRVVDLAGGRAPLLAAEEVGGEEGRALRWAARRCPPAPRSGRRGHARSARPRPLQPDLGLPIVEKEVPGLVAHDPFEQVGQDGVVGDGGQSPVPRQRGQLVDGAPRHVHRAEVGPLTEKCWLGHIDTVFETSTPRDENAHLLTDALLLTLDWNRIAAAAA